MERNTTRELYQLGFRFKEVELWNILEDKQLFAVRLPDGSDGYCSVMGMLGLNLCLAMYLGTEGLSGFWKMSEPYKREYHSITMMLERNGVFCSYDDKEDVSPEDIKEAQKWARALHKKLTRPYPYLHFERSGISQRMKPIEDEQEAQYMKLALQAGLFLSDLFEEGEEDPYELVPIITSLTDEVPLLIPDSTARGGFRIEKTRLPGFSEPEHPVPAPLDEFTLARLKKCKPDGTWDMTIAYMLTSIVETEDYSYIPSAPLCRNCKEGTIPPVNAVGDYDNAPDKMLHDFANGLIDIKLRPTKLRLFRWDTRCQAFVQPLVKQLNIRVELVDALPDLEHIAMDLIHSTGMSDDDVEDMMGLMVQFLDEVPVEELREAPIELQFMARGVLENMGDRLPEKIQKKIRSCMKYWE